MIRALLPLLALAIGYPVGLLFFGALHRVTRALVAGHRAALLWQMLRMVVLTVILWGFARMGAPMLLALVVGMMIGRHQVLARNGAAR